MGGLAMSEYVDFSKRINATKRRIETGSFNKNTKIFTKTTITPYNRKIIYRFQEFMQGEGLSDARIDTNLDKVRIIAEFLSPKKLDKVSRHDIELLTGSWEKAINAKTGKPWTAQTKATYRAVLKKFYRWLLGERGQSPEQTYWIKTTVRQVERETYNPNECFSEEDIMKLIEAAPDMMQKTFVACGYDSAARPEELCTLEVGDCVIDGSSTKFRVRKGKMGQRMISLVLFPQYLTKWLNVHPDRHKPHAPLWFIRSNNKGKKNKKQKNIPLIPISHRGAYNMFRLLCEKAKLKGRKWNLYNLRHSYATNGAKKGVPIEIMSKHLGHTNIKQTMKYYHLSEQDVARALRKAHGEIVEEEEKKESKLTPHKCGRCGTVNDAMMMFCGVCTAPLTLEVAAKVQDQQQKAIEAAVAAQFKALSKAEKIAKLKSAIKEKKGA
ncbi:MAG: site-specific integrase [Candidatus Micrarchaeota archaeon]